MTNRLLISVAAAALIAGTSFANAQSSGGRESPSSGSGATMQQNSPSGGTSSGGTMNRDRSGTTGLSGESTKESTSPGARTDSQRDRMGAENRDKNGTMNQKGAADTNRSQTTTGNAATSATGAPPAEKRTQITTAIKSERVDEVRNVNFNVAVGSTVPTSVHFHRVPQRVVEIYPEWRGYDFILVNGRYVILRPETHEIVYIIEG